eukprot:SAG11_NODE_2122_length_3784_cov_3.569878_4_plen_146_part_00
MVHQVAAQPPGQRLVQSGARQERVDAEARGGGSSRALVRRGTRGSIRRQQLDAAGPFQRSLSVPLSRGSGQFHCELGEFSPVGRRSVKQAGSRVLQAGARARRFSDAVGARVAHRRVVACDAEAEDGRRARAADRSGRGAWAVDR